MQAGTAVWWASSRDAQDIFRDRRIATIEARFSKDNAKINEIAERLARMEERAKEHSYLLRRIDRRLDNSRENSK